MIDRSVERQALMGFASSAALLLLVTDWVAMNQIPASATTGSA
jgi:hypothetical protein